MKTYEATLTICNIEAENKEEAKRLFFENVIEDKSFLNVIIKEE